MTPEDHKYLKTSYPKSSNTEPLSFKRILELTHLDDSVQSITEHVIDSMVRFFDREEEVKIGEFQLTNEEDMFDFLTSYSA